MLLIVLVKAPPRELVSLSNGRGQSQKLHRRVPHDHIRERRAPRHVEGKDEGQLFPLGIEGDVPRREPCLYAVSRRLRLIILLKIPPLKEVAFARRGRQDVVLSLNERAARNGATPLGVIFYRKIRLLPLGVDRQGAIRHPLLYRVRRRLGLIALVQVPALEDVPRLGGGGHGEGFVAVNDDIRDRVASLGVKLDGQRLGDFLRVAARKERYRQHPDKREYRHNDEKFSFHNFTSFHLSRGSARSAPAARPLPREHLTIIHFPVCYFKSASAMRPNIEI